MLLATLPGGAPRLISGFGTTSTVSGLGVTPTTSEPLKKLQEALKGLSTAARNPAIDPGAVDGKLVNGLPPDRTMAAVAASISLIGPKLGTYTRAALMIGLGVGATTNTAKQAVLDYASELRAAAITATAAAPYYVKPEEAAAAETTPSIFASSGPWYKTWWGIGAIAVGAVGFLSLIASARRS